MNKLVQTSKVKAPRASFKSDSTAMGMSPEAQTVREGFMAVVVQGHDCTFTCTNGFAGRWGCRGCNPAGNPVDRLEFVRVLPQTPHWNVRSIADEVCQFTCSVFLKLFFKI